MDKEIIVLAKSLKRGGYCIAGVDTTTGEWIRPISTNYENEGAVTAQDLIYSDGNQVQVLDKVRIRLLGHKPTISQPENYLYDSRVLWKKTGQSSLAKVIEYRGYDQANQIFYNNGKLVSEEELNGQPSLLLINVEDSCIFIKTFANGDRLLQLNFSYNSEEYSYLKISDELVKREFANAPDGIYNRRDNLSVVFSLTGKYDRTGKYYKMVAQIFS